MKKILVLPAKNEAWILPTSLACASLWADHIIVADQNSTDGSLEIYKDFPKVIVVNNPAKFHSSNVRKLLLDTARQFSGNNAIFSFDADEIPTGEILDQVFWQKIKQLTPGSSIELLWVNLWRSAKAYRMDGLQAPAWKQIGFIDDGKVAYTTLNIINDHTSRVPLAATKNSSRFEQPKILHYQFANWNRTMSKQAHYRMTEWLQKKPSWLTALKINLKYFPSKDEAGLKLQPVMQQWLQPYRDQGAEPTVFESSEISWHDLAALDYFKQYGQSFFAPLDIWDIDWQIKAKQANQPTELVAKPQGGLLGRLLLWALPVLVYKSWLLKVYNQLSRSS